MLEEVCRYVASSYVRGDAKRLLLNESIEGILFTHDLISDKSEDVPQLLLNAKLVYREIGARCLWIDAVHIKQDEEVEFNKHMEIMGKIYEGATLTIVSSMPSAGHGLPDLRGPPRASTPLTYSSNDLAISIVEPAYAEVLKDALGCPEARRFRIRYSLNGCSCSPRSRRSSDAKALGSSKTPH